jgi:predicted DCC family thiol-disulfide oxidoreductase YuxK
MPDHVFYDGECGFCQSSVRFLASHDTTGSFRFAPLFGPTFDRLVPTDARPGLPDSLVVRTDDGRLLLRSDAALHTLRRLGGGWRLLAAVLGLLPRRLRDAAYDAFARRRRRWFPSPPPDACPIPSPELRARLDP